MKLLHVAAVAFSAFPWLLAWGCSSSSSSAPVTAVDAGSDGTVGQGDGTAPATDSTAPKGDAPISITDGGGDGGIVRGPASIDFDPSGIGNPQGLWWDDAKQTLYVADGPNHAIWKWTDSGGFVKYAALPDDPAVDDAGDTQLDKLVELADGTLVVVRFGFAEFGAIFFVSPDGGVGQVPNVDPTLRRIGLTVDSNNQIWGGGFVKSGSNMIGHVTKVNLGTGETTYANGLQKPEGLLVVNGRLLVGDFNQNEIFSLPTDGTLGDGGLPDGAPYPVYASLPIPDQLALGPNGIIFTGQFDKSIDGGNPAIREIFPDGGVATLAVANNLTQAQDVTYDQTNKRLFVADSNGTTVRTIKIFPID